MLKLQLSEKFPLVVFIACSSLATLGCGDANTPDDPTGGEAAGGESTGASGSGSGGGEEVIVDGEGFDDGTPLTFAEICAPDASGFPANANIVNCWGFESDDELFYHDPQGQNSDCIDPDTGNLVHAEHVNGRMNPSPIQNAGVNTTTCRYPERDNSTSASGDYSLRVYQVDGEGGGGNSAGTFFPYMKHYVDSNGTRRFVAFGAGGEFWIHWRYRQNDELFQYHSKRFMVTHHYSSFENVLGAYGDGSGVGNPPYRNVCAYNNKGTYQYGCADGVYYQADVWHTFVMHVRLSDNMDHTNGLFELFMDGERVLFKDGFPMAGLSLDEPFVDDLEWSQQAVTSLNALFRLDFLLFENGKTGDGNRPMGSMWIDDIIVSKVQLPPIISTPRP